MKMYLTNSIHITQNINFVRDLMTNYQLFLKDKLYSNRLPMTGNGG